MKITVKKEKRKSIALSLTPEELVILIPEYMKNSKKDLDGLLSSFFEGTNSISNYSKISREEFKELLLLWAEKLNVKPRRIQLRKMSNKWASCSTNNNFTFHLSLIKMPNDFVEYVICHELLHLKVQNHSGLFKSLMNAHMPDWEERVTRTMEHFLRSNGMLKVGAN